MSKTILAFSLVLLFSPIKILAEIGTFANPPDKPEMTFENGKPAVLKWKDGREATTVKFDAPPLVADVPSAIYENSCNGYIASKCAIRPLFQKYIVGLIWTRHPKANRVGKPIIGHYKDQTFNLTPVFIFLTSVDRVRFPIATKNLPEDIIFCDDYKFLPHDPFNPPNNRILKWDVERMFPNPETGGMENRTMFGALDVDLMPLENKSGLRIQVAGGYTSTSTGSMLIQGDIVSWTLRDSNQKLCQIGLKPNFNFFVNKAQEYINRTLDKFGPYNMGSDEFSQNIPTALGNIFANPNITLE